MKLKTGTMNTKRENQIECYNQKFFKLSEMIRESDSKELKRQRRNVLRKLVYLNK